MAGAKTFCSERDQFELFRAPPGDLAPRDVQGLMAYPFLCVAEVLRDLSRELRDNTRDAA